MTVSLITTSKFESAQHKDFVINHEIKVDRCLTARAATQETKSPTKRDPILQINEEPIQEFKSTIRRLPEADKMAMFSKDVQYSSRRKGEFNDLFRARSVSPKIEGIRCCNPYREHQPEVKKRELKEVDRQFRRNIFNPITEGDPLSIKPIKTRVVHPEPSDELMKMNNKKTFLSASLAISPRGRIFRDTNQVIGEQIPEALTSRQSPARTSRRHREKNEAKGLIEYSYSPDFRDQGVSGKCTAVPLATLLIKPVHEEDAF